MARGFDDITPNAGRQESLKIEEIVDIHKFSDGVYETIRLLPHAMLPVKTHWIRILGGKEKKEIKVPRICVSFDPDNEKVPMKGTHCPYCDLSTGEGGTCSTNIRYYANAIIRDEQENEPRKAAKPTKKELKTGFKEKGSKSWTPVRVVPLPSGLALRLQKLKQRNITGGKAYAITHEKNGCDVAIMYDSKASAANAYTIDRGEKTPLTKEEKKYLIWDLNDDIYDLLGRMDTDQAEEDFKRQDFVGSDSLDDDDDDDEDSFRLGSKKKKKSKSKDSDSSKKKKSKKSKDDDDEPKKKKKSKKSKDDDDEPKKKKKSKSKDDDSSKKKKSKKSKDDEPKKKKKKKANF